MDHCCSQACCCHGAAFCLLVYCPCGALRSYCRRVRLCEGPDRGALQPCEDRRCFHCFGHNNYSSSSEDDLSEESLSEEEEEDSGFDEMD